AHGPGQSPAAGDQQLEPHDAPLAINDPPLGDLAQPSRSRWGPDPTLPLTAMMVVALLVGGIAAVLGRSQSAPTTVASASAPSPASATDAARAAPPDAMAKAREQYLQVAATSNAELDRLKRQGMTDVSPA